MISNDKCKQHPPPLLPLPLPTEHTHTHVHASVFSNSVDYMMKNKVRNGRYLTL